MIQFGSTVSGKTHSESDIDIAYFSEQKLELDQELNLIAELEAIFKQYKKVDLVDLRRAGPLLGMEIVNNCKLLYGDNTEDFITFKINLVHKFEDYKPYFKLQKENNKKLIDKYAKQINN